MLFINNCIILYDLSGGLENNFTIFSANYKINEPSFLRPFTIYTIKGYYI